MIRLLVLALAAAPLGAAPALQIIRPAISQMEDGAPDPPGFDHIPGEILFFSCRIAGYAKTEDSKIQLAFSVQAFDPEGVPLTEIYRNEISDEVAPQDKEWQPRIRTEVQIPPLVTPGTYRIVVKVEDRVAKAQAELPVPFQVRGHEVASSEVLVVRNFRFFRGEDDEKPLEKAAYRPGDGVWARFDISGYKYGPKNKIDVNYVTSVIAPTGRVLWTQPEPAAEQSESFYPKRYVPASMGINLQGNIRPGEYTIAVTVKDAVGGQTCESKYTFVVE
jgi:hypothetical protein